ncbi:MAG TPA: aldo/keto reductase [Nitrososphaeraceae archaeon]|jgi:diketogulonate reductase-like aldo/keto reductase
MVGQPIELSEFLFTPSFVQLRLHSRATLNNGVEIPRLGLGVYQTPSGETTFRSVRYAFKIGYRHIDTASLYGNERDVGRAVLESGIPREEIFVTTKVWNTNQGYDPTIRACERSLRRLGLSYIDLYLIHWPVEGMGKDSWKAMIQLLRSGKAKTIGVSNYDIFQLQEILQNFDVAPSVNQVEFHPFLFQEQLLQFCNDNSIQLEAYSPLTRGNKLNHPTLRVLQQKYSKTSAQILIRWSLQHNLVVIPKSTHENRIKENSQVFDFQLDDEDMKVLDSLNENFHTVFL